MALDRERVVRTALGLLDEVGLDGLTLRRIGDELDVKAPALYWHFRNKQELLDEMATTLLRDLLRSATPGDDVPWSAWLTASAQALRQMLLRHRDGAKVVAGTYLTDDTVLASMELPLRKLTDAGFTLRDAVRGWSAVYCYTIGFTIEEQAVFPKPGVRNEQYDLAKRDQRIDGRLFPLTQAAGAEAFDGWDDRFAHGIALLVAGMQVVRSG